MKFFLKALFPKLVFWQLFLIVITLSLTSSNRLYAAESYPHLTIICSEIEPYAFREGTLARGAMWDLAVELSTRLGQRNELKLVPLSRSLELLKNGPNVVSIWIGRIPERENHVKWLDLAFKEEFSIYTLKGKPTANTVADAQKVGTLGLIIAAATISIAKNANLTNLSTVPSEQSNLKKLISGRLDGWITSTNSMSYLNKKFKLQAGTLVRGVKLADYNAWVGGSPDLPISEVNRIRDAFAKMKADGSYKRILDKNSFITITGDSK